MQVDFSQIQGPCNSRDANFQELIGQLLHREIGAETLNGSGGDKGIDSFSRNTSGGLEVFQVKYFLGRLGKSQWVKIRDSFETAWRNHQLERWVLCTPRNPTIWQRQRFDEIVKDRAKAEWWGETTIRALLEKHPDIHQTFFPEEVLAGELRSFRQQVVELERAVSISRWRVGEESAPLRYLSRVVHLSEVLLADVSLFSDSSDPVVAVDFSELHTFMESDPSLAITVPIVDYCIEKTPRPLTLPPGTVQELREFVSGLLGQGQRWLEKGALTPENKKPLLDSFVRAYEEAPDSALAWERFRQLISTVQKAGVANLQLKKLLRVLDTFLIPPRSEAKLFDLEPSSPLRSAFDSFQRLRPGRHKRNLADAVNMNFLLITSRENSGQARLMSSAHSLHRVWEEVFGRESLVRTAWEYAYLVHLHGLSWGGTHEISELGVSARSFLNLVRSADILTVLHTTSTSAIQVVLRGFAPFYRDLLRPVDRMVESGLLALPRSFALTMSELYVALKSEADLVAGFRRWWEQISITLQELDTTLARRYDGEYIAAAFADLEKKVC